MSAEHSEPIQRDLETLAQEVKELLISFQLKHYLCPDILVLTHQHVGVKEPQILTVQASVAINGEW